MERIEEERKEDITCIFVQEGQEVEDEVDDGAQDPLGEEKMVIK